MALKETILVCTGDKHNKFYIIEHTGGNWPDVVSTRWGRIGTKGQSSTKVKDSYNAIIDKRWSKGYYKISKEQFEQMTAVAQAIGTAHKINGLKWVNILDPDKMQIGAALSGIDCQSAPPEVLADPNNNPAIVVSIRLRKKSGDKEIGLLFFNDKTFQLNDDFLIEPSNEILEKMPKISAAIGESL
jgi:predicted DNA-binding WGR domain protein